MGIVSFALHRFPFAASAEYGPWGKVSSKLPTGWSGTALNVLLVMPALLMNVSIRPVDRDAIALQDDDQVGELFPTMRNEIRRTFQRDRDQRCDRLCEPDPRSAGQPAGFALNCAAVHAFCNVVNLDGSCFGRSTLTFAMFACAPARIGQLDVRLAPAFLDVLPVVETLNIGLNASP